MHFTSKLNKIIDLQNSVLCVGLDPDLNKLPNTLRNETDSLFKFCKEIIESTASYTCAFKINFAFFEAEGTKGWDALERLVQIIPVGVIKIADAKRADIGNSSQKYAEAILKKMDFDAITVSPYMGTDSIAPFLQWPEKGVFILALTSNPGSTDFQQLKTENSTLYLEVAKKANGWNTNKNCGLVVGATNMASIKKIRKAAPELPFLIPGVGVQGGSLEDSILMGADTQGKSVLINASRSIIYKSSGLDFAEAAASEAQSMQQQMNEIRNSI